jgi:hypothetical protein
METPHLYFDAGVGFLSGKRDLSLLRSLSLPSYILVENSD